jgi:C-terminal processing protease CtpA/Prc
MFTQLPNPGERDAPGMVSIGDQILEVEGAAASDLTLDQIKERICGPRGTMVVYAHCK